MGTFEDVAVGQHIAGPSRTIGHEATELVRGFGGYIHPLFTDPSFAERAGFDRPPLPGELVLFLLGGMAEQTGVFDDTTVALVALDAVRFGSPVAAGDRIVLDLEVLDKRRSSGGNHGTVRFLWRCTADDGREVLRAEAELLFRVAPRARDGD